MNHKETDILDEFNRLKPQLNKWGELVDFYIVDDLLKEMVDKHLIKIEPQYRIKDDKSYLFKALYRKKNYGTPLKDIEDKIGTRVVVLKSDDIKLVQEKILKSTFWQSKLTKDIDQEIEDKPSVFDYQSSHIVVYPQKDHVSFDGDNVELLTCEIQIRTLLQHAFAEVSHDSTYKGPYKNDKEILRRLAKTMALMEATDDYFCNIFEMMSDDKRHFSQYLNEVVRLYKHFKSDFDIAELDLEVSDSILSLLELLNVSIEELEVFCNKKEKHIKSYIQQRNGQLFLQPTILLSLYYFYNHRTFLNDNWPLNNENLKSLYKATGTSYKSF